MSVMRRLTVSVYLILLAACNPSAQIDYSPSTDSPVHHHSATLVAGSSSVTIQQAIRDGCYSAGQLRALFDAATFSGRITKSQIDLYFYNGTFPDNSVTKMRVNAPTWVYRGYGEKDADNWHVRKLKQGILYSKAQNRVDQGKMDWNDNGPQLSFPSGLTGRNPTVIAMRLLAIQSSDKPTSQFNSVALDYDVAKSFGNIVYAFLVQPDSEILGLRDCRLGGEDQLQIAGGTTISKLHRRVQGGLWMKYDAQTNSWIDITGSFPPN